MNILIIKHGYNITQIIVGGKYTTELQKWIDELNNNPLNNEEWIIDEKYTNKYLDDIVEFLLTK